MAIQSLAELLLGILAVLGLLSSVASYGCVGHEIGKNSTKFFRPLYLAIVGVVGYLLILFMQLFGELMVRDILVYIATLFSVYLAVRAYKIRLGCPVCPAIWIINAILFVLVLMGHNQKI